MLEKGDTAFYGGQFWAFLTYFPEISHLFLDYFPKSSCFLNISHLFLSYFPVISNFSSIFHLFLELFYHF